MAKYKSPLLPVYHSQIRQAWGRWPMCSTLVKTLASLWSGYLVGCRLDEFRGASRQLGNTFLIWFLRTRQCVDQVPLCGLPVALLCALGAGELLQKHQRFVSSF